ncbi:MAG: AraC family transcriptional regulator [Planctomycetota bacterium]
MSCVHLPSSTRGQLLADPAQVLRDLPFEPTVMAADWPLGVQAERYAHLPGNELRQPGESHVRVTLQMAHAGALKFAWGGQTCELAAGAFDRPMVTVTPAGMESAWSWSDFCESFHVVLPVGLFEGPANGAGLDPKRLELRPDPGSPSPLVAGMLRVLELALGDPAAANPGAVKHLSESLAMQLVHTHGTQAPLRTSSRVKRLCPSAVALVEEAMRDTLDDPLSVVELATLVHCSTDHFIRAFKKATGLTPKQRMTKLRVERVTQLMHDPLPRSKSQIAEACGFCNPSHMARVVHRQTGLSLKLLAEK